MVSKKEQEKGQQQLHTDVVSLVLAPSLYLGPCSAASNQSYLTTNSITHVLSVGSTPAKKVDGVTYHRLSLNDSPSSSITRVSDEACKIIDGAIGSREKGGKGKILVHCSAGISRSPTLVTAYLMRAHNMSLKAALGQTVRARPQVSPNAGFFEQLKRLEIELYGSSTLEVDVLPLRELDRLALFEDNPAQAEEEVAAPTAPG